MKANQKGGSALGLALYLALVLGTLFLWISDHLPADAADVQALVSIAASNAEARKGLAETLKATPNPNRLELRKMHRRINDVMVTEVARQATGDKTLKTPAERQAEAAARRSHLQTKPWSELSSGERMDRVLDYVLNSAGLVLGAIVFITAAVYGWWTLFKVRHSA